jgi:hypothetical protein
MTKRDLKIVQEAITKAVRETVNGKIDNLKLQVEGINGKIEYHNSKHEADMEEIKPFIQGARGLGLLWKVGFGIIGAVVLWGQFKQMFPTI